MEFIPLYFGDKLKVVNPHGVIGVVTLWSKPEYVMERFREARVDLDSATSPIAVFGTLYGNGLREFLRNLLYNPQIQVLLICGHDRSGSQNELLSFFDQGLEPVDSSLSRYRSIQGVEDVVTCRIKGTGRLIDSLIQPSAFDPQPRLIILGDPKEESSQSVVKDFFNNYNYQYSNDRIRLEVPLPEVDIQFFPSNPRGHQLIENTPIEAWIDIIFLITRYGRKVTLKKGDRLELQNLKVVVEKPVSDDKRKLLDFNFDPIKLRKYQSEIIQSQIDRELKLRPKKASFKGQPKLPSLKTLRPDEAYNYGDRLRDHFKIDGLQKFVSRLKKDPEDRKCYFTLWDNSEDLRNRSNQPCFVSLFFRKFQDKLTLTATFRTHNALDGWLLNLYGLMAIQKWVSNRVKIAPGPITVMSHSISIDPRELDRALAVVEKRRWKMHLDPMGYFRVTLDGDEILVEHRAEDVTLKEYRGRTAMSLQHQIARDMALSDLNHAMYLGRQLAKAEMALKEGREFVQD
jgi:thymidylate synthase